jgi:hypothetical protein
VLVFSLATKISPKTPALRAIGVVICSMLLRPISSAQQFVEEARISTPEEIRENTRRPMLVPLEVVAWPFHKLSSGMERGFIAFERHRLRERMNLWTEELRHYGGEVRLGGSGEGAGFGGGGTYTFHAGKNNRLQFLGLETVKDYQEFGIQWRSATPAGSVIAESSYQWRPDENFYGIGHNSVRNKHSMFALRQTWAGLRWEYQVKGRLRWGALYRAAWISALRGGDPHFGPPDAFFSNLTGYDTQTRLGTAGIYFDMDGIRNEYQLGGATHFGASYQHGFAGSSPSYFAYETQLEGRLPVSRESSAFVGQANFELTRERHDSSPIPFYMLPHIGGSSTLRGFALDRFYGRNLALLSLEYRYRIHPFVQVIPFFDEGQIFDRSEDLSWLNWHRNYGLGFRFRSPGGATFMRVEYGHSSEASEIHIVFGDRERPPLRGPFRYGAYKR